MNTLPTRIDLIKRLPPGTVGAEIGVYRGDFSKEILTTPVRLLYLVDPWAKQPGDVYFDPMNDEDQEHNFQVTLSNVREGIESDRVQIIRDFSVNAARSPLIQPLDWVFLDGNHQYAYVLEDLIAWSAKLKPTGVILGHDYIDHEPLKFGIKKAVGDFCQSMGWRIDCLTEDSSYRLVRD
jgi:hypothetical protein